MKLLLVLLISLLSYCYFNATQEELLQFFNEELQTSVMKDYGIYGIGVSVFTPEYSFFKGYGYEDHSSEPKKEVSKETVFSIGSISKIFTSILFMKEYGVDSIEDDINTYLDEDHQYSDVLIGNYESKNGKPTEKTTSTISFRNLATHTAGYDEHGIIGYPNFDDLGLDIKKNMPPRIREPFTASSYNNYGIGMLGYLIQEKTGVEYGEYLKNKVFSRLGMNNSYYGVTNAQEDEHLSQFYVGYFSESTSIPVEIHKNINAKPCGAVFSNHKDFEILVRDLMDGGSLLGLSTEQYHAMFSNHFSIENLDAIDFVFYENTIYGIKFVGHNGDITPFHALLMMNFDEKVAIFITMAATTSSIREVLLDKFALKFMRPKDFCETTDHAYVSEGYCSLKYDLSENWPRDSSVDYKEKYEDIVGCYVTTRFPHTGWEKFSSYFSYFLYGGIICFQVNDDNYLEAVGTSLILLDDIFSGSSESEFKKYVLGQTDGTGNVLFSMVGTFQTAFKKESSTNRYFIIQSVFGSYEYMGDILSYASVFLLTFFFGSGNGMFLVFFVLMILFCCVFCCVSVLGVIQIIRCIVKGKKTKNGEYVKFNEEILLEEKDNQFDIHEKDEQKNSEIGEGKEKKNFITIFTIVNHIFAFLCLVFSILSLLASFLHWWYIIALANVEFNSLYEYPTAIIQSGRNFAFWAVFFCVVSVVCMVIISISMCIMLSGCFMYKTKIMKKIKCDIGYLTCILYTPAYILSVIALIIVIVYTRAYINFSNFYNFL